MQKFNQLALQVLEKGYLLSLATVDEGGPWVSDVIYTYDDDVNIYWMSLSDCRHSVAIKEHPQVAGTITVSLPKQPGLGLQISGVAKVVDAIPSESVHRYFEKRGKSVPKNPEDVLGGRKWYRLKPDYIELIDEAEYGHEKRSVK